MFESKSKFCYFYQKSIGLVRVDGPKTCCDLFIFLRKLQEVGIFTGAAFF